MSYRPDIGNITSLEELQQKMEEELLRMFAASQEEQQRINDHMGKHLNPIINGRFDFWQRGTNFTAAVYTADRWRASRSGETISVTRQAFTPGQSEVKGNPVHYLRFQVTSLAGIGYYALLTHLLEGAESYAGKTVTLTFDARADAALPISFELARTYGSGGSVRDTALVVEKLKLKAQWTNYKLRFKVPSAEGKVIGENSYLELVWWLSAGSNFDARTDSLGQQNITFDIANVKIEEGEESLPWVNVPLDVELLRCQRYYQKSYSQADPPGTATAASSIGFTSAYNTTYGRRQVVYTVEKRITPAVTLYSPDSGASGMVRNISTAADITGLPTLVGPTSFLGGAHNAADLSAGHTIRFHYEADAEL